MSKFIEVNIDNILVMAVSVTSVSNSTVAFNQLESKLDTLKGRKFYGCLTGPPETGTYRACVALISTDNPKVLGLDTWTIPEGKYLRTKIINWPGQEHLIGQTFKEMSQTTNIDTSRPYIEFYRSQKELILLLPTI